MVGDRFYTLAGRAEKKGLNWILGRQCLHRGVQLEAMMQIWQANPVEPRETKPFTVGAGTLRWFYCIACEMRNKTMSSLDLRFFLGFWVWSSDPLRCDSILEVVICWVYAIYFIFFFAGTGRKS